MTTAANTHLVIADDHPLFRDALRQAVASVVSSAVISEAGSFDDLTALLERDSDVDLILLDLTMPGISGFSGLIYLRAHHPAVARFRRLRLHPQALRRRDAARRHHESDGGRRLGSTAHRSHLGQRSRHDAAARPAGDADPATGA